MNKIPERIRISFFIVFRFFTTAAFLNRLQRYFSTGLLLSGDCHTSVLKINSFAK